MKGRLPMEFQTHAMMMRGLGGPEVLEYRPLTLDWDPAGDAVLVRLVAAGVNPADTFFRRLGPYLGPAAGCVLGHDGAGVVQAAGAAVKGLAVGDRVCFCHGGVGGVPGTYAEHAVVPAALAVKVPDAVRLEDAAAIALVFITGWEAMIERAQVGAGDLVLIHGGAGGTGQMATQIACSRGARVVTTVSSAEKAQLSRQAGAEHVINYRAQDFAAEVMAWSDEQGVRAVLYNIGGAAALQSLRVMAPYGHFVTLMGGVSDTDEATAYNANLTIHNLMMLTPMWQGLQGHLLRQADILRRAMNWLDTGRAYVRTQARFTLREAARAHELLEAGGNSGKLILTMPQTDHG
ncbi:MAG: zinc-binding dehydrogenase [Alphaproteobacteria bacterium]